MNAIKSWIEEHPYVTGSAVLALIVFYFISSGSSSGAQQDQVYNPGGLSSSDLAAIQNSQVQAGASLQAQQVQATQQNNQLAAELAATALTTASQDKANELAAQVQLQNIVTSGQVQMHSDDVGLQSIQAQIGGQVVLKGLDVDQNEYISNLQQVTLRQENDNQLRAQQVISAAQTAQSAANASIFSQLLSYLSGTAVASKNPPPANGGTFQSPVSSAPLIPVQGAVNTLTGRPLTYETTLHR